MTNLYNDFLNHYDAKLFFHFQSKKYFSTNFFLSIRRCALLSYTKANQEKESIETLNCEQVALK